MRKQMFKKSHYLKITFLLLLLIGWPVVTAHSAVLPVDRQLESALLQGGVLTMKLKMWRH